MLAALAPARLRHAMGGGISCEPLGEREPE